MDFTTALSLAVPLIYGSEGCELAAYLDTLARPPVWTIGHGTTRVGGVPVERGMVCSQEQADLWAMMDLGSVGSGVVRMLTVPVNEHQCAALTSLAYNIGIGAFGRSSVLEALNHGLYRQAADRFLEYDDAGGVARPGLESRRARERAVFMTGMPAASYPGKASRAPEQEAESPADVLNDAEIALIKRRENPT
jgi:lysozyme